MNRGTPHSALTRAYAIFSEGFRFKSQIARLSSTVEEFGRVYELQNSYITLMRTRAIEMIHLASLISVVIAVDVGLNAIQMPPFYEAVTTNVLGRKEFCISLIAAVVGIAILALILMRIVDRRGAGERYGRQVRAW